MYAASGRMGVVSGEVSGNFCESPLCALRTAVAQMRWTDYEKKLVVSLS
jgi:hypothetical protein